MPKVLALNKNGDITYCTCPEELRGTGRCNHIAHQNINESSQDFITRINEQQEKIQNNNLKDDNNFVPYEGTTITTNCYRMSDEEKVNSTKIENRMQLDQNIDGGYIELEEPLWNDMDKNYFSNLSGIPASSITSILHEESYIVTSSEHPKYPVGKILPASIVEDKNDIKLQTLSEEYGITFETGVTSMNKFAKENYNFEPTKDVYVLPYYMRMGTGTLPNQSEDELENSLDNESSSDPYDEIISSDITIGYKYLLRQHKDPNKQQLAYEALLNNSALTKNARFADGYRRKSLADKFVGKGGVFRACLSGNSIPYSARTVVTPTVDMNYGEIKIPPAVAVDIYKPTLLQQFASENYTPEQIDDYFSKCRLPQTEVPQYIRDDLERRISDRRVIMNRQPSLHTSSLQSFIPKISDNATTQVHPLYCKSYGMDFDGDTCSLYGINQSGIIPTVDKSIGAKNPVNTHQPRSIHNSAIKLEKDALWGILNILDKRTV